jgi:hypothetical protein
MTRPSISDALNAVRFDEIARLADLASSYWRSISLAADRGDAHLLTLHCRQIAKVTREAFAIARTLVAEEIEP